MLECPHRGDSNEYTQHTLIVKKIKKISRNYHYLLPDLAPWLTLSCSRYPCIEHISMIQGCSDHWSSPLIDFSDDITLNELWNLDLRTIKYKWIYPENATVTKHSLPEAHITKTRLFKYTENFTTKKWKFSDKKILIFFHISAQKHRLWVLVRTASPRRF